LLSFDDCVTLIGFFPRCSDFNLRQPETFEDVAVEPFLSRSKNNDFTWSSVRENKLSQTFSFLLFGLSILTSPRVVPTVKVLRSLKQSGAHQIFSPLFPASTFKLTPYV